MGFVGHPVVEDMGELVVLPDLDTGLQLRGSTGTPQYYTREDTLLVLWPAPDSAVTVTAQAKIVPVLTTSDALPWQGLFDNLIVEAAARLSTGGQAVTVESAFAAMVDRGVSAVLIPRMNPLPRVRPINYF